MDLSSYCLTWGAAANLFLDALTQEIIPFIDANYRTMPTDRCLQGYSAGGIFALYVLFHRPDAFQRYISGSGVRHIQYDYWLQRDAELAARDGSNPLQLYLSFGELEEDDLTQGNYPGLTVSSEIYSGEGHGAEGDRAYLPARHRHGLPTSGTLACREHACALAAAGLTLGDTIRQWDTADSPTDLPEVEEPLPGAANRVVMPAVLQEE